MEKDSRKRRGGTMTLRERVTALVAPERASRMYLERMSEEFRGRGKSASASAAKSIASAGVSLMAQKPPAIIVW